CRTASPAYFPATPAARQPASRTVNHGGRGTGTFILSPTGLTRGSPAAPRDCQVKPTAVRLIFPTSSLHLKQWGVQVSAGMGTRFSSTRHRPACPGDPRAFPFV